MTRDQRIAARTLSASLLVIALVVCGYLALGTWGLVAAMIATGAVVVKVAPLGQDQDRWRDWGGPDA